MNRAVKKVYYRQLSTSEFNIFSLASDLIFYREYDNRSDFFILFNSLMKEIRIVK